MTLLELLKEIFKPEPPITPNISEKAKKESPKQMDDEEELVAFSEVEEEDEFFM